MAADGETGYGLDNAWPKARARLTSLEDWLDPICASSATTSRPRISRASPSTSCTAGWSSPTCPSVRKCYANSPGCSGRTA
jgi:hypothetical protein